MSKHRNLPRPLRYGSTVVPPPPPPEAPAPARPARDDDYTPEAIDRVSLSAEAEDEPEAPR